jgi:Nif-specific regulatory protein
MQANFDPGYNSSYLAMNPALPREKTAVRPRLIAVGGPLEGHSFALPESEGRIGRAASNWLSINHPTISREHCLLRATADGWQVVDLESHNGTLVNDEPVHERLLGSRDRIRVGTSVFVFVTDREARVTGAPTAAGTVLTEDFLLPLDQAHYLRPPGASAPKAQRDLQTLLALSTAIQAESAPEAIFREVAARAQQTFGVERVSAYWLEASGWTPVGHLLNGSSADDAPEPNPHLVDRMTKAAAAVSAHQNPGEAGECAVMAVPLTAARQSKGFLYLEKQQPEARFSADDLEMATAIGAMTALALDAAFRLRRLELQNQQLLGQGADWHGMIGESAAMKSVCERIGRAAVSDTTVLILGENGTGKELAARALHRNSRRAAAPFVAINCATLHENLLESELFGHERGAFTGALMQKKGKVEMAEGGTLFLDEIGELAPGAQAKLLRLLQEREYERLGGTRTLRANIRVAAATNRDLKEDVKSGRFREDLFFRLNVIPVTMPPLRERVGDIPLLVAHFLHRFSAECNRPVQGLSAEARALLMGYDWPGNVRELQNAIERAVVLSTSDMIEPEDLPEAILESAAPAAPAAVPAYCEAVRQTKRREILEAIRKSHGNVSEAARALGLHPNYLHRLVTRLGLRADIRR